MTPVNEDSKNKVNTAKLICQLTKDLTVQPVAPSMQRFLVRVGIIAIGVTVFVMLVAGPRGDIAERSRDARYYLESAGWLFSSLICAALVYRSSVPSLMRRQDQRWGWIAMGLLAALLAYRVRAGELAAEMDLSQGRCGLAILAIGAAMISGIFYWVKRAAPTQLGVTGFWAALSAGSLGAFAMQLACAHDSAAHVWAWHVIPIAGLALGGVFFARRQLRWGG